MVDLLCGSFRYAWTWTILGVPGAPLRHRVVNSLQSSGIPTSSRNQGSCSFRGDHVEALRLYNDLVTSPQLGTDGAVARVTNAML